MDREKLVIDHMENVARAASKYYYSDTYVPSDKRGLVSLDDLISAGYEALIKAAEKYDDSTNVKFITYAYKWIDNAIKKELYFYVGPTDAFFDENIKEMADIQIDDERHTDIDPKTIHNILKKAGLTANEIEVYCMFFGIGRDQVKNPRRIANELCISEIQVRRLKQNAERKVKQMKAGV